jgi:hypothetical protein
MKSAKVECGNSFSKVKVSVGLAAAISEMKYQLTRQFGVDYSFTVIGNGHLVAASNYKDGVVSPHC